MKLSNLFSWLPVKLPGSDHGQSAGAPKPGIPELRMIIFIVDWERVKVISGVFEKENVSMYFISRGKGTASSEVLDLLGIGSSDKAVIICLEKPAMVPVLLQEVRKNLNYRTPGAGIAFTLPLSAINNPILRIFKQTEASAAPDNKANDGKTGQQAPGRHASHNLVMAVVNRGYSDELMNTARKAGASGGTVLNARCQTNTGAVQFFGISVQDERELIIILTNRDKGSSITKAIAETHGLNTGAQGIVFSLPVENVMSLAFLQ